MGSICVRECFCRFFSGSKSNAEERQPRFLAKLIESRRGLSMSIELPHCQPTPFRRITLHGGHTLEHFMPERDEGAKMGPCIVFLLWKGGTSLLHASTRRSIGLLFRRLRPFLFFLPASSVHTNCYSVEAFNLGFLVQPRLGQICRRDGQSRGKPQVKVFPRLVFPSQVLRQTLSFDRT